MSTHYDASQADAQADSNRNARVALLRMDERIRQLEAENARLLEESDNWRVSSVCRDKQAMIDHLTAQIKKLEEQKQRIEEGEA